VVCQHIGRVTDPFGRKKKGGTAVDRRQFCRSTVAAGALAAYPFASGCRRAPVATEAETSIPAVSLEGKAIELERAAVRELGESLSGPVLLASDPGYDEARRIWNGMHDKHPALIAQCKSAADVSQAVTFARERQLLVAVRGGGHSWPGKSTCDGGLMIDLSPMNDVAVDPARREASAGGGALLNALDTRSLEHGLITTAGVVSHTGVGGYTLGGGFGRLNRKYGLTIDNLLGAEIVTADGKVRTINADQEPDLFWAIRGGGGNFGVVTRFVYQLYPFNRTLLSGMLMWPIDQAKQVLDFYRSWYRDLSDEMYVGPAMLTTPDSQSVLAFEVVYNGDPVKGEKELKPLRAVGKPSSDGVGMNDYMTLQTQDDGAFHHGIRSYAKNGMVKEITPAMVDAMIGAFRADPRFGLFTHTSGGAVKRIGELDTAFPHRNAETILVFGGGWEDPAQDDECIGGIREWYAALEPFTGGYYQNIDFAEDQGGTYGPAYSRLQKVKSQVDPMNLFRLNTNIQPAA
jgi:FAD/FMN-containing dehydrogenase